MTAPDGWRLDLSSEDDERVRDAIRASVEALRAVTEESPMAVAEALAPLVAHRSPKVRQAVADACELLPPFFCERALPALLEDDDAYVRRAAERAAERRAARRAAKARDDDHDRVVAAILAELEDKHGKGARRLAERAALRDKEAFVERLHHELTKIVTPLELSLHRARAELDRAERLDRGKVSDDVAVASERLAFLWSVVQSARAYTRAVTPSFREERLAAIVEEAGGHLVDRLGPRGARVRLEVEVDPALSIDADRHALLQALQNLLQNGAEAYDAGAPVLELAVRAKTIRRGAHVVLAVSDRGSGMSGERLRHLFVPFGSSKPGGTGVGLLIARKMIEEVHGGALAVESAEGRGTTIRITLPVKQRGARPR